MAEERQQRGRDRDRNREEIDDGVKSVRVVFPRGRPQDARIDRFSYLYIVPMLLVCARLIRRGSARRRDSASVSRAANTLSTPITPGSGENSRTFGSRNMLYCEPKSARG